MSSADASSREQPAHVRVLRWDDEARVGALLARAFVDDPLVLAICNAPAAERARRMGWSFRVAVRSHCLAAQPAWMAVDEAASPLGVVLVTRPRPQLSVRPEVSSDLRFALRGFYEIGLRAGLRGLQAARIIGEHAPAEPFTYLRTLGVDPSCHRQGIGSRLVEQVIRTSPTTLPVYLETAKEQNLAFYTRHGFECIGEFRCLDLPVWRLQRFATA